MKVAIIGDIHLGSRNDILVLQDAAEDFFKNEFWPTLDRHNIKNILCTGDLFDRRKYINFNTLFRSHEYLFSEMESRGVHMDIIPGNHDVTYKNTNKVNSLSLLLDRYIKEGIVTLFHDPVVQKYDTMDIGFVPWMNEENYDQCVGFIRDNSHLPLLIGHFEMSGIEMLSGVKSEHGLSTELFRDYEQVISGHFHTPSINGNIWYPGSPLEFTWADYGQSKGFVILDTETREYTKQETKARMFHKVFYDDTNDFQLKKDRTGFPDLKGKFVKIIVRNRSSRTKFESWMTDLYERGKPYDVTIIDTNIDMNLTEEEMRIETLSTMEIIESTIDNMIVDVSKNDLKRLFHDLYNESLQMETM